MFVNKKLYNAALKEHKETLQQLVELQKEFNQLAREYKDDLTEYHALMVKHLELLESNPVCISPEDLKSIISLCHPDKHDNSKLSNRITKLLNELREGE